jgi:hypothetical protein
VVGKTLEPARAGKCQVSKQGAEYRRMLVFMPEGLSAMRTSMPNRQISLQLLSDDLFFQAGQQRLGFSQGDTHRFDAFCFPFQASQFLYSLARFALGDQLNLEFHGTLLSV